MTPEKYTDVTIYKTAKELASDIGKKHATMPAGTKKAKTLMSIKYEGQVGG